MLTLLFISSFNSQNDFFAIPILFLISCKHLVSAVISVPRYLYIFTCPNAIPCDFIANSVPGRFYITINFVLFAFNSLPKAVELSFTL